MLAAPLTPVTGHVFRSRAILVISLHADPTTTVGAPENGGVTIYVRELARALAENGWSVDLVTRRSDPAAPASEWVGRVRVLRVAAGPAQPLANDAIAPHLHEALARVREIAGFGAYEAISSHYWLSGWIGDALSDELGVPHLHTLHSLGISRNQRDELTLRRIEIERRLLERARIVTLGHGDLPAYRERYGVTPRRIAVIPAGVDLARFSPGDAAQARRTLGIPDAGPWIGYVGRLAREKGIDDLIAAFARLHELTPLRPRLFVVGGAARNSRVPALRALAARLGVEPWTQFLGPIPHRRVAAAFQAADLLAVPSHYEAFGLVAIEARACGTPVVASDVGGLRESVTPASGGCRVPPRDVAAWAEALRDSLDPRRLAARREAALHAATTPYGWSAVARRIVAFAAPDPDAVFA